MRTPLTTIILCAFAAGCSSDAGDDPITTTDTGQTVSDTGNGGSDTNVPTSDMAVSNDTGARADDGTSVDMGSEPVDLGPPPDPLEGIGAVELVQEGFQFTEGPRWYPDEAVLRFTDIPANTIFEWVFRPTTP